MHERGYAKINLALHVRSRLPDGYHDIETLFAFCEDGDLVLAEPDEGLLLQVEGPFSAEAGPDRDNLVLRAARALRQRFGIRAGARLRLLKALPAAAGLGGGSADAAAAIRLLVRLWKIEAAPDELGTLAASLGADVPACLGSRAARGEGRGERLVPLDAPELAQMPALLVNPGRPVATPAVFAAWDGIDRGPLEQGPMLAAATRGRNDLEAAARAIAPEIGAVLEALRAASGTRLVRMSGSGATCFALFGDVESRDRAAAAIGTRHPGWWQLATRLR